MNIDIKQIPAKLAHYPILELHYAKRLPPISWAFGAFCNGELVGVVTFGKPVSSTLRDGVCGKEYSSHVFELNRLWCQSIPNLASRLVSSALRMLPKDVIVVSYADTSQGHVGYVYQATNFLYTGLSAKRTDWSIRGLEHLHSSTISDMSRGMKNRAQYMRERFGSDFYLRERPRKHRYVYAKGRMREALGKIMKYPVHAFPKGDSLRYEIPNIDKAKLTISL